MRARRTFGKAGSLAYLLSVPDEPAEQRAPLLCFLHGYDEGAPAPLEEAVTRHGPLRPGSDTRVADRFVVLAPQLPRSGDLWHLFADDVHEMVQRVQLTQNADERRTYLTGFSFGGNGVFDLALLQPDIWAALWPVDPTRVPAPVNAAPIWLSFGEVARRSKAQFIRALNLRPQEENDTADRVFRDEGADHVGSATLAYQDPQIYDWLLTKSRS